MNSSEYRDLTVSQLKDKLQALGLPSTGTKLELVSRLLSHEPVEEHAADTGKNVQDSAAATASERSEKEDAWTHREMEMALRERDIMKKELELARREIEMMQRMNRLSVSSVSTNPTGESNLRENIPVPEETHRPRMSITAIADLLNYYDGDAPYEHWERQFLLLKRIHRLTDCEAMVLLGSRLRGKAAEWFHSRPEYVTMTIDDLSREMRTMFHHLPNRASRKRDFEQRRWKYGERFSDYYHQKIILGNRVPVDEEEMIEYLIEGIPDVILRNQARIERFQTRGALFSAFEKVVLQTGAETNRTWRTPTESSEEFTKQRSRHAEGSQQAIIRCHNCGAKGHRGIECPLKERGTKCFQCRGFGHIAAKCPERTSAATDNCFSEVPAKGKYSRQVVINDLEVQALIDTGSDVTLMRADVYHRLGAPRLRSNQVYFNGIGSKSNRTLGEFTTTIEIDGNSYPITIHIVSESFMRHSLLLGTDFLDTVQLIIKHGHIEIQRLSEAQPSENDLPEVLQVEVCEEKNQIDALQVRDPVIRDVIPMVDGYKANSTREIETQTSIVLEDEEFRYTSEHRPRTSVRHVGALSRSPLPECMIVSESDGSVSARVERAQVAADNKISEHLEKKWTSSFNENLCELRECVKGKIEKIKRVNRESYCKRREKARSYQSGDLVAIERAQQGLGSKLRAKYFGPYRVKMK